MNVFISTKPLNISTKRIIATTIEEFSDRLNNNGAHKGDEESRERFNVIDAINSAVRLVELKEAFEKIDLFATSFKGILNQDSINGIRDILAGKVIDNVHISFTHKNISRAFVFTIAETKGCT